MNHDEAKFKELKDSIKSATSKKFAVSYSLADRFLFASLGVFVAMAAFFALGGQPIENRLTATACVLACSLSVLSAYRMVVPFALRISYADMLRIRLPFYVWMTCGFLLLCLSKPIRGLLSGQQDALIHVSLTIVAICQAVEYFRKGRMWHLLVSSAMAGAAVELSSFGLCAPVLTLATFLLMKSCLLSEDADWLAEGEFRQVCDQLLDQSEKTMKRMVSVICFCAGASAAFAIGHFSAEGLSGIFEHAYKIFDQDWLSDLSKEGVIVVVAVGIVPLLFALCQIEKATDTAESFEFVNQVKYLAVGCAAACFILWGGRVFAKLHILAAADFRYWTLGLLLACLALLTSASVALVDVWCRVLEASRRQGAGKAESISTFCQAMLLASPVILVLVALIFSR